MCRMYSSRHSEVGNRMIIHPSTWAAFAFSASAPSLRAWRPKMNSPPSTSNAIQCGSNKAKSNLHLRVGWNLTSLWR